MEKEFSLFHADWDTVYNTRYNDWRYFAETLLETGNTLEIGDWQLRAYLHDGSGNGQVWFLFKLDERHRPIESAFLLQDFGKREGFEKLSELTGNNAFQVKVDGVPIPDLYNQISRVLTALERGKAFWQERHDGDYTGYTDNTDTIWYNDHYRFFHLAVAVDYPGVGHQDEEPCEYEEVNRMRQQPRDYLCKLNYCLPIMNWVETPYPMHDGTRASYEDTALKREGITDRLE